MENYFEFQNPTKINAGHKALESIGFELERLNVKRPLFVSDRDVVKLGLLAKAISSIEQKIYTSIVFSDIPSDSSLEAVENAYNYFVSNQCDGIVAIGGGSVIDSAKGINILISENSKDIAALKGHDRLKGQTKPLIIIPTTSGTGSEVTLVAVIADKARHEKMLFTSWKLIPDVAILDPEMTISMPAMLTAATAVDALTHAIESMTCLQKNPFSDIWAKLAIKNVFDYLEKLLNNPFEPELRMHLALASCAAGVAFSNSMVGAVHAIGHSVGATSNVHHGVAMGILLPRVVEFNADQMQDRYAEIYDLIFPEKQNLSNSQKAIGLVKHLDDFMRKLNRLSNLPISLKQAKVKMEDFDKIASLSLNDGALMLNPKDLNKKEILEIIQKAFDHE